MRNMSPKDIYSSPTRQSLAWHDAGQRTEDLFENQEFDRLNDVDPSLHPDGGALVFLDKLVHVTDGGESALTYTVAEWKGRPVAVLLMGQGNAFGDSQRFITDIEGFREARAMAESFIPRRDNDLSDVVPEDAPTGKLTGSGSVLLIEHEGALRLIDVVYLDHKGRVLLDDKALGEAFHRDIRPAFDPFSETTKQGLANPRMRDLAVEAIRSSVRADVDTSVDFEPPDRDPGQYHRIDEGMVLARTEEGTYLIGASRSAGFHWLDDVVAEHVGGPELFDALARDVAAPAP